MFKKFFIKLFYPTREYYISYSWSNNNGSFGSGSSFIQVKNLPFYSRLSKNSIIEIQEWLKGDDSQTIIIGNLIRVKKNKEDYFV